MKNAPITIKALVVLFAVGVLGFGVMEINRTIEVREAKNWCEEYALIMLERSQSDMDGLPDFEAISKTIGWKPRIFLGAYGISAYVQRGVAKVTFDSAAGCYSYTSVEGWEKTSNRMPIMVGPDA